MTSKKNENAAKPTRGRASRVAEAWKNFGGKNSRGELRFTAKGVALVISGIKEGSDEEGDWVDVYTGGSKPSLRICNPPELVRDPEGDIEVVDPVGRGNSKVTRYRNDPVAAVAEVLAQVRKRK